MLNLNPQQLEFYDLGLDDLILDALDAMNIITPTPIQQQSIPLIMEGHDMIACAQTGTGKTAAFVLPIVHRLLKEPAEKTRVLILAPTRELAVQIDQQIEGLSYFVSLSSIAVYGGGEGDVWEKQKRAFNSGVDIIVATPGRLLSFLTSGVLKLNEVQYLVLDEADRMLDMGFYEDIMRIISFLPEKRQTVLFSATMSPRIRTMANSILKEPKEVSVAIAKPASGIDQQVYMLNDDQKDKMLQKILEDENYQAVIVFSSSKEKVKILDRVLRSKGLLCKAFHSDLKQNEREDIIRDFRNRKLRILVGTDILSRGIDIEGIDLVVNYDAPHDAEDYVHRIGRTARAATTGTAITFINAKDMGKFLRIEKLIEQKVKRMPLPEELGPGLVEKERTSENAEQGKKKKFFKRKKRPGGTTPKAQS